MLRIVLVGTLALASAGCAAPAAVVTPAPTSVSQTPATTTAATTGATAAPTAAATTVPGSGGPVVDLTFTGAIPLGVKGSGGQCQLGHAADGSVAVFGYLASEADFPGLGTSFNIVEDLGSNAVTVKWVVAGTFIAGTFASGATVAPDHRSVTFDADMPTGISRTEHLKGSISCP
jgi:hypothetical protein